VLHISPIAEPPQGIYDGEPQQKPGAANNGIGVFAKILSGMLGSPAEARAAAESGDAELFARHGELSFAHDGGESDFGFPSLASLADAAEARAAEMLGAERSLAFLDIDLSQDALFDSDQDFLGSVAVPPTGVFVGQAGEQAAQGARFFAADAVAAAGASSKGDPRGLSRETSYLQSRDISAEIDLGEAAADKRAAAGAKTAQAGGSAGNPAFVGENARTAGRAETAAAREGALGCAVGKDVLRQAEAGAAYADGNSAQRAEETRGKNQRRSLVAEARELRGGPQAETVYSGANSGDSRASLEGAGREITLEVRMPNQSGGSSATTAWESRPAQGLESMLARELHQNLNGDIVRQAAIILRDGNEGIIRLALRPESLGNVKIHLEMAENKITGYIIVESEEALRAFEREIASLEKEFREAGFEGAELQMSLAGGGGEQQWQETEEGNFLLARLAASRYDDAAEMTETIPDDASYWQGTGTVDVLA